MFQSDDQQLFIGKIPPEVQESDLRVSNLLIHCFPQWLDLALHHTI